MQYNSLHINYVHQIDPKTWQYYLINKIHVFIDKKSLKKTEALCYVMYVCNELVHHFKTSFIFCSYVISVAAITYLDIYFFKYKMWGQLTDQKITVILYEKLSNYMIMKHALQLGDNCIVF